MSTSSNKGLVFFESKVCRSVGNSPAEPSPFNQRPSETPWRLRRTRRNRRSSAGNRHRIRLDEPERFAELAIQRKAQLRFVQHQVAVGSENRASGELILGDVFRIVTEVPAFEIDGFSRSIVELDPSRLGPSLWESTSLTTTSYCDPMPTAPASRRSRCWRAS